MADIPRYLLGQPELSEQTQRAFDLKADLPQFTQSEYNLSVQVDDWTLPEYRWLRRNRQYRCGTVVGPVAAQFSYLTQTTVAGVLPGSQMAVVESVMIANTGAVAAQYLVYTAIPAVLGVLVNAQQADDRQTGPPAFEVRGNSAVAVPVSIFAQVNIVVQAGDTLDVPGPWILTGNQMLVVAHTVLNVAIAATFLWRERPLLSSER